MSTLRFSSTQLNTVDFVNAIRRGSSEGMSFIYEHFYGSVKNFVLKNSGNEEDARDMFQEGLILVYNKLQEQNFELTCPLGAYLYSVCRNLWMNQCRKKYRTEVSLDGMERICVDGIADRMDHFEQRSLFLNKMNQLAEDERKVLQMHLSGHNMKEIAATMGYASEKYARKKKCVSKKKLMQLIQSDRMYSELAA